MFPFEELLKALQQIREEIQLLRAQNGVPEEEVMTIEGASEFLKLSKPDIYAKISEKTTPDPEKRIPHYKRGHKTLYFLRSELLAWIKRG